MLQPTPIRMENYGNTAVKVLRDVPCISEVEGQGLQTVFLCVTDCDRSPNLLSRDACYTLGVLKPCYTVENSTQIPQILLSHTVMHQTKMIWQLNHFFIRK